MGTTCRLVRLSSWDTHTEVTTIAIVNFVVAVDILIHFFFPRFGSYVCASFSRSSPLRCLPSFIYYVSFSINLFATSKLPRAFSFVCALTWSCHFTFVLGGLDYSNVLYNIQSRNCYKG